MRQQRSLAGNWEFQLDPDGQLTPAALKPDRSIPVPVPWQAAFPDLQQYSGYAWYRLELELDAASLGGELLLHFGAVDYWCEVFVNDQRVGGHEGGYTPFTLPIRRSAQTGRNVIAVRVYDSVKSSVVIERWPDYPVTTTSIQPPFDANHIPHGKQEWYINVGGIWQDVTLTAVSSSYLERVHVTPDIHSGIAKVAITLAGDEVESGELHLRLHDQQGLHAELRVPLTVGQRQYQAELKVANPRLWEIDEPHLYQLGAILQTPGGSDEIEVRFGFREIATRAGQLLLNGRPLFLLSALDQDLYPHTIYTVPSDDFLRDQFAKAKALGLNNLRCHIKPPDPRYLDLADEMGLLVWAEIPSWRTFYPKGTVHPNQLNLDATIHARVEQSLVEMVQRDYNHPSLIIWTLVNEDWGTALPLSSADRAWVADLYTRCKQLDPTRLAVDNSACGAPWGSNIHVHSDIDDFHIYANIPDHAKTFTQAISSFGLRPLWTYSQHGDAERTGQEPLILSEFGNWGLPSLDTLRKGYNGDPAWFDIGPWWSPWDGEPGWARGVDERWKSYGLDKIWESYEAFATATQWHQWAAFKYEIETMRRQPALAGYVITEFTDAYWEANGLLDFLRTPKAFYDRFHEINAPDVIVPELERWSCWSEQQVAVRLHVAHYSNVVWANATLSWSIPGNDLTGSCSVPALAPGTVAQLDLQHFTLPAVERTQTIVIELVLHNGDGSRLARNTIDLLVIPAESRHAQLQTSIAVVAAPDEWDIAPSVNPPVQLDASTPVSTEVDSVQAPATELPSSARITSAGWTQLLKRLGYQTTNTLDQTVGVAVSLLPTAELLEWVHGGGDLLHVTTGASPFYWVQSRTGTYGGNWMTNFSWLRPSAHHRLAVPSPLTMPFRDVMPKSTLLGLPVEEEAIQPDFLAGLIGGWVRHPAIHTVQFRYGKGRVIMTTFSFEAALKGDPVSIALLHDLLEHLHGADCQPVLRAENRT